jgi:rod shape-determining protein MreD
MIMERGKPLLARVNPSFIWFSLFLALILHMLIGLGNYFWTPDLLAMTLVFWSVHQPRRVGMGAAFVFGLMMDVHESTLLGQNALAYTLLCFGAVLMHRRLLWFPVQQQSIQVLPLFAMATLAEWLIHLFAGHPMASWSLLLAPLIQALLWPLLSTLLLIPQRRDRSSPLNRTL